MIVIREMTERDAPAVKEIEAECRLSPWTVADYMLETQREDSVALVAAEGNRIVGFLIARLITINNPSHLPSDVAGSMALSSFAEIMNIGVLTECRRKRLATQLLSRLESDHRSGRLRSISLEVRQSNVAAIAFYRLQGFRITGLRPKFYRSPQEDALIMEKQLTYGASGTVPPPTVEGNGENSQT